MDKKKCTGCGKRKLLSEFGMERGNVKSACKKCACKKAKEYAAKNPEKVREASRKRYWEHRDENVRKKREYYYTHREESIKAATEWAQTHKDQRRAYMREYFREIARGDRPQKEKTEKHCPACDEIKPVSEFGKNKYSHDGLQGECKACKNKRGREYTARNKEMLRERSKKTRDANKDKLNAKHRERRRANHAKFLAAEAEYREKNRERLRKINQRYAEKNKDKRTAYTHNRAARLEANGGEFTPKQWKMLVRHYSPHNYCLRCGKESRLTVDHVFPVSLGGRNTIDNLQPLCRSCNCSKKATHVDYRPDSGEFARSLMIT